MTTTTCITNVSPKESSLFQWEVFKKLYYCIILSISNMYIHYKIVF